MAACRSKCSGFELEFDDGAYGIPQLEPTSRSMPCRNTPVRALRKLPNSSLGVRTSMYLWRSLQPGGFADGSLTPTHEAKICLRIAGPRAAELSQFGNIVI